jgi:hypothetical protein
MPPLYLIFCPYVPLDRVYAMDKWSLTPLSQFGGGWASADFEGLARRFVGKFDAPRDKPLASPAVLVRDGVADGLLPSDGEQRALQAALHFAVLDANPTWTPDADGWSSMTSDNGDVFVWPIDSQSRSVALQRGSLVRNLGGGYRIERDDWRVRPPLELHMPDGHVRLDAAVLDAVYRVAVGQHGNPQSAGEIELSISWLAKAWRNTPSVSPEDRLVELKTAFDGLVGESTGTVVARQVRNRFEALLPHGITRRSAAHMLWRPSETERMRTVPNARGQPQQRQVTDLEEWFAHFAAARNQVVHRARRPPQKPPLRNRYRGPYFHTAERLLRECIRASLAGLGYTDLWRSRADREMAALMEAALAQLQAANEPGH